MWQCPDCGETHEDQFATCWKCGTTPLGARDGAFRVSEPIEAKDQAPVAPGEEDELPSLELPAFTYFSIPLLIWTYLVFGLLAAPNEFIMERQPSPLRVALDIMAGVLVSIPMGIVMLRWMFFQLIRRHKLRGAQDWPLKMFRLPQTLRERHRWFVPVYYGSFVALPVGFFGIVIWHAWNTL